MVGRGDDAGCRSRSDIDPQFPRSVDRYCKYHGPRSSPGGDFATAGARLQLHQSIPVDRDTQPIAATRGDGRSRPSIRSRLKRYLGIVVELQSRLCLLAADPRIIAVACGESEGKHKQRSLSLYCEATGIVTLCRPATACCCCRPARRCLTGREACHVAAADRRLRPQHAIDTAACDAELLGDRRRS